VRATFSSPRHLQPSRKRSCRRWFDARPKRVIGIYRDRLFVKNRSSGQRYELNCPVMVQVLSRGRGGQPERGELLDVGLGGARFTLRRPLAAGTRVFLDVHFSNPPEGVTTIRFKGIVTRSQQEPPHEIAVRFQSGGRFLRGDLNETFRSQPVA